MNDPLKVLIIEGTQYPPAFIRNLMEGLISVGSKVALLGKEKKKLFTPQLRTGFRRIVSDHSAFNLFHYLLSFLSILFTHPGKLLKAAELYTRTGYGKVNFKRWITTAKILIYDPHVIHIQWATHIEEFETLLKRSDYKFILSLRGTQINVTPIIDKKIHALYQNLFPHFKGFHAVSNAIATEAAKYGGNSASMTTIYSPVPDIFLNSFRTEKVISKIPLKIISVGRFHWIKGYIHALDAMKILMDKKVDFYYTIIAEGEIPEEILHQAEDLKLKDRFRIVIGMHQSQLIQELQAHSVFLLPSIKEGISNAVLESMATGLPVISTDCGGMNEVITHNETGFLISPRDPQAIAGQLMKFTSMSEDDINRIRHNAFQKIKRDFSYAGQVKKFIELYQTIN